MNHDNEDKVIERHFMRALDAALRDEGFNYSRAEARAGLAQGTISHWMSGNRMPNALRFAQVCDLLGLDPGAVINDGWRRAREAGLLSDVTPVGTSDEPLKDVGSLEA